MVDKIRLTREQLQESGEIGEKEASRALSLLAKKDVKITTTGASTSEKNDISGTIEGISKHMVIAYTQTLIGFPGISLLVLKREDALNLVDCFNGRPLGTTKVMKELDRSTIKETLNILANAYVKQLADKSSTSILLSVPKIITADSVREVTDKVISDKTGPVVTFETNLGVSGSDFSVDLMFFFMA